MSCEDTFVSEHFNVYGSDYFGGTLAGGSDNMQVLTSGMVGEHETTMFTLATGQRSESQPERPRHSRFSGVSSQPVTSGDNDNMSDEGELYHGLSQ